MNILMFVMAMLMMFSVMTYAKLNKYKMNATLNSQFEKYMEFVERKYINERAVAKYEATYVQKRGGTENNRNYNSSKLPMGILLQKNIPIDSNLYVSTRYALKDLMKNLYSNTEFYKTIIEERSDFIDEIINALPYAKDNLPNNLNVNKAKDLANLQLNDEGLNEVFYKMLKGAEYPYETKEGMQLQGYPSLIKYITTQQGKKIRVFLASEVLLRVIFDESTTDEIMRTREYFYSQVNNGNLDTLEATQRFISMFENKVTPNISLDLLDFSITKTDPKKYR
ncbi:MAG: hypothetical protein VX777_07150 [Chlamydiota bacterium]|nr:hypothetical protein [Chlamydiota bacterium]